MIPLLFVEYLFCVSQSGWWAECKHVATYQNTAFDMVSYGLIWKTKINFLGLF